MKLRPSLVLQVFALGLLPLRFRVISSVGIRNFSDSAHRSLQNAIYDSIRIPPTFHDYLRACSASNSLLLVLFTTSLCAPCQQITPLLPSLVRDRLLAPDDKFAQLAFTEAELDSSEEPNGRMMDLGVEDGITSPPTLAGFGGRRAEKLIGRLTDTKMMADGASMESWMNEAMRMGDPSPGSGGRLFGRLFS